MDAPSGARASRTGNVPPSRKTAWWPAWYVLAYFLVAALSVWWLTAELATPAFLALIGVSVAAGFAIHARAKAPRKGIGRRLSVALVGLSLFLGAGIFGRQSFQLEGLFFYLFAGLAGGVVIHYLVAKIIGPIFIGRAWCAWGCWIWMVFDYLPWHRSPGRRSGLGWIRYAHLAASIGLVSVLVWVIGYDHGFTWKTTDGFWWFGGGCAFYYVAGIGLAVALHDNRAFCKYLCPVSVLLSAGNQASLLRIAGDREACKQCSACERICPMDVKVLQFVTARQRVSDPECTLCQRCVEACSGGHLHVSLPG